MQSGPAVSSATRIAGRVGYADPTLSVFSSLFSGFFLSLDRILGKLGTWLSCPVQNVLAPVPFVIFVFFHYLPKP